MPNGLLDWLETPAGQGLLAAGFGALANAGHGGPLNTLGRAGMNGLLGYTGAQDRHAQLEQDAKRNAVYDMQVQAYQADVARKNEALEAERRKRQALPTLFQQPGVTGGEAAPQTMGGIPMFSQPMGVTPMRATPGGLDWMAALKAGYDPKEIQELQGLTNIGRPKATRQMEVDDGKGGKRIALVDDFGREVAGFAGYTPPVQVNQGDRISFVKPAPGVALPVNMSPEAKASNALGWANNALTRRGQDMTDARAREANAGGKVPSGYRLAAAGGGLEFIPGGPADPNVAKRAAPTEFQGKSTTFAARMQDASKVIGKLEGKVWPSTVARAGYKPTFPDWLPGGQIASSGISALNALTTPEDAQRYAQAQENWVTANLRQESGAVIGPEEMEKDIRKWFPQPGDSDAVKKQKAEARKVAERAMLVQSGPGAASVPGIIGEAPPANTSAGGGVDWEYVNGKLIKAR